MATVYALVFSINYPVTVGDFSSDCFSYGWPVEFDVPASPVNLYMYIHIEYNMREWWSPLTSVMS